MSIVLYGNTPNRVTADGTPFGEGMEILGLTLGAPDLFTDYQVGRGLAIYEGMREIFAFDRRTYGEGTEMMEVVLGAPNPWTHEVKYNRPTG